MKKGYLVFSLAVMVFLGGCLMQKDKTPQTLSGATVRSSYSPSAKFPAGSKYAFVNFASDQELTGEAAQINQRIQTSLANEFNKKGFKPSQYTDIDFFVVYAIGLQHQIDVLVAKSQVQGNEWIAAVVSAEDYVSGALLVQIISAKSMEPVWLGVFNADIMLVSVSEREKQERVRYAVRQLLQTFPPKE
jgi:hypothetical protein